MTFLPRRRLARPPLHDCTGPGTWFLTVSTRHALPLLGHVVDAGMHVNELGAIVRDAWVHLPAHFPHVLPDDFVVMPNHLHALLVLGERACAACKPGECVERYGAPVPGSVATIVRSFKAATTRLVRDRLGMPVVVWQPGYYSRRIYGAEAAEKVRHYIAANPRRWTESHPRPRAVVRAMDYVLVPVATEVEPARRCIDRLPGR